MTHLDLGNGHTIPRHHVPKAMLTQFDEASAALSAAQASIRLISLIAVQAPAAFSGTVQCSAMGQSGTTYNLSEVGGALLADERDVSTFTALGFTAVPSQQPTSGLRPGIVFFDTAANGYMRFDGAAWAPVTLI
jgi:hypothetical protein